MVGNSGRLDYSEVPYILAGDVNGENFANGTEKSESLASFLDKKVDELDDHDCPKVQDLVDEEIWICSSYPFRHKTTLRCAEFRAKKFGNWIMHHLNL